MRCSPHTALPPQLAKLIHVSPCTMNLMSTEAELKDGAPKEDKALPAQHNFLRNWQRNLALRKKQQEALSGEQRPPGSSLATGWQVRVGGDYKIRQGLPGAACSEALGQPESAQRVGLAGWRGTWSLWGLIW